ncbi:hypothetical protein ACFQ0K_11935 [Nocardioides caeni]|uniref:Secreted protein n=1 Tax=Nocardioides caeni TaxID=574700 RepID=A0A4S8NLU7_9ACTN|nr:hypothetical protein [Nocardioides caeni]THV17848.1 hypothetical protein E9934_05140 [Nocardioides caeni]
MTRGRSLSLATAALLALTLAACGDDEPVNDGDSSDRIVLTPPEEGASHIHAPGQEHGGAPLGDGTRATAGGYTMADVALPGADQPGEVAFRILGEDGEPLTSYVEEQTKLLHLYVVRVDLGGFRHLHPTLDDDGTWRAQVDLDAPGQWRVIAEFMPGGAAQAVVVGQQLSVAGDTSAPAEIPRGDEGLTSDDGVARVEVLGGAAVDDNGRLQLSVTDLDGAPLTLGSYLGTSAHLTGFALDTDAFVHVHPYGAPEITDDGTVLTFHTTFTTPGDYRMFLQFRVDGLLHQVAVTVPVSD